MLARTLCRLTLTAVFLPALAFADGQDPDCQCRDPNGERRDLGTVTCVRIGKADYRVRCEMSTNTPYWRRLDEKSGCPQPS